MAQIILQENYHFNEVGITTNKDGVEIKHVVCKHPFPLIIKPVDIGGLTTEAYAASMCPEGYKYKVIEEEDYEASLAGIGSTAVKFVEAIDSFDFDTQQCVFNLERAKKVAHRKRRNRRYNEFAPHDDTISKAIPGTSINEAEVSRVGIRSTYATMQTEIDNCSTIDEIYDIVERKYGKSKSSILHPSARQEHFEREDYSGIASSLL